LAVTLDAPDGRPLAISGGVDGVLRLWNLNDGTAGAAIAAHDGPVSSIDISADGDTVASGGMDGTVHLWNPVKETTGTAFFHGSWVNTVRITADGSHLLSVADDGYWRCGPLPVIGEDGTADREPTSSGGKNRGTPAVDGRLSGTRAMAGA